MTSRSLCLQLLKRVATIFLAPNNYILVIKLKYFDISGTYFCCQSPLNKVLILS